MMQKRRRVLIGVGGGIAAYKVCEIVSSLAKSDVEVRVVLTDRAEQFVSALTFACLSRNQAYTDTDFWNESNPRPLHIELGEWADVILLAPLTANTLAKLALGLADNLLTNVVLASSCPVLVAPAMNTDMWQQVSVQTNWRSLTSNSRYHLAHPTAGVLACDRVGMGRMAEPSQLLSQVRSLLCTGGTRDLVGKHLLISAGSTREFWDPVRFIGNPATGKMGIALAQAAGTRGATVTLVHGPMEERLLASLSDVVTYGVTSASDMATALAEQASCADWLVMAAAVADVKPAEYHGHKLPKRSLPASVELSPVPDILAQLSHDRQPHQVMIGFAAQTGDIVPPALDKLKRKHLDVIVANPIDQETSGFSSDTNQAVMLNRLGDRRDIPLCSKLEMAHSIYDFVLSTVSS
ncbi:MAG: bifunctional phosphopantothenoylcysteine decarboxylase/phosphopantothenate--cysteine ligase CoaBC [Leptolyngbyaceae bacterium]|nr:bifunctional phosphopantothenoylcysteine decarboxylase/phosphopantothenate--cysteine ligase CoaBC [Leptolyngbyaceae bacterium]